MSTYPKLKPGVRYVIRRKQDGLYLTVRGWSVGWEAKQSHACPVFTSINLGPSRTDDWHAMAYYRHHKGAELVPFTPDSIASQNDVS